jgi:hypothetical protein
MGTVLVFILRNFHSRAQVITLRWNQELRSKLNFRLPVNDYPCRVSAKHDKILIRFSKTNPAADWGPLENLFEVDVPDIVQP